MKKKNLYLSVMLFFSILPLALFTGCDKDTNCYLDVKVIGPSTVNPISGETYGGGPVAGAIVEIFQSNIAGSVSDRGTTNSDGVYSTHFKAPAIVNIKAAQQLYDAAGQPAGQYRGETSVRLIEGETLSPTITLGSQIIF